MHHETAADLSPTSSDDFHVSSLPSTVPSPHRIDSVARNSLRDLLLLEWDAVTQPKITYEALVIRLLRRLARTARVSWTGILETTSRQYVLDEVLQLDLTVLLEERKRNMTPDEQNCFERLLAYDNVKHGDLVKLSTYLGKGLSNLSPKDARAVWTLFAVDGSMGSGGGGDDGGGNATDLRLYLENFRDDEIKLEHARAVRVLYRCLDNPDDIHGVLKIAFDRALGIESDGGAASPCDECVGTYLKMVPNVKAVIEWKAQQSRTEDAKKNKKTPKRKAAAATTEVVVDDGDVPSDEDKLSAGTRKKVKTKRIVVEDSEGEIEESEERIVEDEKETKLESDGEPPVYNEKGNTVVKRPRTNKKISKFRL